MELDMLNVIKKLLNFSLILLIASCANSNTIPGGSFLPLDIDTVEFIENTPSLTVSMYGDQSDRKFSLLNDTQLLVAISGGGQRAAAFTMGVLAELEHLGEFTADRKKLDVLNEVDYFSSVSGGGWASSAYISDRFFYQESNPNSKYILNNNLDDLMIRIMRLEMSYSSNCLISKIDENMTSKKGKSVTLGDIFVDSDHSPSVPYLFYNSTIQSNHAPFVFTREYINYFEVESFSFCGKKVTISQNYKKLPISIAVGTASSVPGFRFTQAKTSLCDSTMKNAAMCSESRVFLHLFDGGVYDNLGYKTGIEVLNSTTSSNKIMIVIDANADTDLPIDQVKTSEWKMLYDVAKKSTLAANAVTAKKFLKSVSKAFNIAPIVLSFSDAAGYIKKAGEVEKYTNKDLLDGLDGLTNFIERDSKGKNLLCQNDSVDVCADNMFYRVGLSSKTSHMIDKNYYKAVQDLGRLVVRLKAEKIKKCVLDATSCID